MDARLKAVMQFVTKGAKVVDIGTDHGYLAIELIREKNCEKVIATDKNKLPLESSRRNIIDAGFQDKIDLRLGDGLTVLKIDEIDEICIAGLGGSLIVDILKNSPEIVNSVKKIIIQPMNAVDKVREFMQENNYFIYDEDLAEVDEIIYEIICFSRFKNNLPTKKSQSILLKKVYQKKIEKLQRILDEMSKSSNAIKTEKYLEIRKKISELEARIN